MKVFTHELRGELLLYSRSRELAFFTFFLPLIFFVLLGSVYGSGDKINGYRAADYLLTGMIGYGLIATAFAGPALTLRALRVPVVAVLHQPPGGIDHSAVRARAQAPLDRLALRRAEVLLAASDHLAEQLVDEGFAESRIRVVPPGRAVAIPPAGPRDYAVRNPR